MFFLKSCLSFEHCHPYSEKNMLCHPKPMLTYFSNATSKATQPDLQSPSSLKELQGKRKLTAFFLQLMLEKAKLRHFSIVLHQSPKKTHLLDTSADP